jgi:hypothetical protein
VAGRVLTQSRKLIPGLPAIGRFEEGGIFGSSVDRVRVSQRRLQVPDTGELPGVLRAVVPLMGARHAVVLELVADRLPCLAAIVRALHRLAEPAARL